MKTYKILLKLDSRAAALFYAFNLRKTTLEGCEVKSKVKS